MEICFPDVDRQKLFCQDRRLQAEFGAALARLIACRLDVLDVIAHLGLLSAAGPLNLRAETGDDATFSLALDPGRRLHFRAHNHQTRKDGTIKLPTVRHVEIIGVDLSSPKKARKS